MQNDELRKTQIQLEETSQKYFDLFNLAPVGYLKLAENGTILELNLMAAFLLGDNRASLINKSLNSFITRKDRDIFYLHLQESQKTKRKQSCEVRFQKKGGTEFYGYMECQPIFNEQDNFSCYNTALFDISERKLAEEALLRSEEKYKTLFEAANDAIFVADPVSGNILDVNKKALELTGYSRDELIGQHRSFIHPQDSAGKYTNSFNEAVKPGVSSLNEVDVLCRNGSILPVEISSGGKTFIAGRAVHFGVFRDISKRKQEESRTLLTSEVLKLLNNQTDATVLIHEILQLVKNSTGIEAVGLRLQENEDYPYYQTTGFPRDFVEAERFLCSKDEEGNKIRDASGDLLLECMCGNIIRGRIDPTLPFFTRGGSFWSNCTTELLSNTSEKERQSHTRNRCNGEGYESVALIPLRSEDRIIGLLQLNDQRKNQFSLEMIRFFEGLGNSIGIALKRIHMEKTLQERESHLASIIKNPAGYMIYRLKAGPDPMSPIVTHVSPSITEILGIKPEDCRNYQFWFQNVHPEDLARLIEA